MNHLAFHTENENHENDKNKDNYNVYVVFELPELSRYEQNKVDASFLHECLECVRKLNDLHMHDGTARSHEYFTSLNHSERTRIPKTLSRMNLLDEPPYYGILGFHALRGEPVKNKAFNQRIASINPDILVFDRLQTLFVSCNYPGNLSLLGHPVTHEQAGFVQINLLTHRFTEPTQPS